MGNVTTAAHRVHAIKCIIMIGGQLFYQAQGSLQGETAGVAPVIFNRVSGYLEESNYKAPHNFKMGGPLLL